jgi:hypothetical protein
MTGNEAVARRGKGGNLAPPTPVTYYVSQYGHFGSFPVTVLAAIRSDTIEPLAVSERLRVSLAELAQTAGVPRESLSKTARIHSRSTQTRLRELLEILNRVEPWAGGALAAFAWYRSQSIPAFGDMTAEALVRAGRIEELRTHLDRIAAGGFA